MSISYGRFLRFGLAHLDQLPALAAAAEKVVSSPTALAKWDDGIDPIGRIVAADVDELLGPEAAAFSDTELKSLESELCECLNAQPHAAAIDWKKWDGSRLLAIWKVVGPLLPVLLGLLK